MRICCIADGRYIHTHRWLDYFCGRGHAVHFLSFEALDSAQAAAIEAAGAVYHGSLGPFHLKRFWWTLRDRRALIDVLRSERVELLYCQFLGVNAWHASLTGFRPLVISVTGGDVCGPGWRPTGLRPRVLTPLALRRADLITCWSRQLTRVVGPYARPGVPVEVVHGGVDLDRFAPGPRPTQLLERWGIPAGARVVFSPRLTLPLYNLDVVVHAMHAVAAQHPEAYCLFASPAQPKDAGYDARVRAIAGEGPAAYRIRFIGAIAHHEMADYYRLADVTVSVPFTDGTPMAVLESMACGTPVVVSDLPDYDPDYIEPGRTVFVARYDDVGSVAGAIRRSLEDTDTAQHQAKAARDRVEAGAGVQAQMSRLEELYTNLVSVSTPCGCR